MSTTFHNTADRDSVGIGRGASRIHSNQQLQNIAKHAWSLTPATFAHRLTRGRWIAARHLLYLSTIISTAIARGNGRILIMAPPRHGKSLFMSVHTPAWFLERYPGKNVITCTYSADLAADFALKVRDTFTSQDNHQLVKTRIRTDRKRLDNFATTEDGIAIAVGIGGAITGRGADLLLIDDYVKNVEESRSQKILDKTWEWFQSTAYTRLEPNASLVILATRWSVDDLIGRCLRELPHENWTVIRLPAIAQTDDPLGRAVGEPLWPERYDVEALMRIKDALGSFWFDAMYQQAPRASMSEIALGDTIQVIHPTEVPSDMQYVRSWDLAGTEGEGDWTVGVKVGREVAGLVGGGRVYITDIQRFRKSPLGNEEHIANVAAVDGPDVRIVMEQEPGSSGIGVIDNYRAKILTQYYFEGIRATGPLEVRAQPLLAACEAGRLCMVDAPWNQALRDELNAFPEGVHDDQIVACAQGYTRLIGKNKRGLTWGRADWLDETIRRAIAENTPGVGANTLGGHRRGLTW